VRGYVCVRVCVRGTSGLDQSAPASVLVWVSVFGCVGVLKCVRVCGVSGLDQRPPESVLMWVSVLGGVGVGVCDCVGVCACLWRIGV